MLSKRDKFHEAAARLNALRCPACGLPLFRAGEDYACQSAHRWNLNRKGFLHLLSERPETGAYDAELFAARRRVFATGCYDAAVEAIDALLGRGPHRLLDAGCGDGWYLNALLTRHPDWSGAGVDISRDAILQATDQPCEAVWCVADLRRLPFQDGAFTALLDVLTPAGYEEFRRVVAPGGVAVKVYPGGAYLREIRGARGMPLYEEGKVEAYLKTKACVRELRSVTRVVPVTDALWRDFVWMTPLNQDLSSEEKECLAARNAGRVTVDLRVALISLDES